MHEQDWKGRPMKAATKLSNTRSVTPSNGSPASDQESLQIEIKELHIETIPLSIVGDSTLIVHAWGEKTRKMLIDKHTGKMPDEGSREAKEPVELMRECLSPLPGGKGFGFPAIAVKKAMVAVANQAGLRKVDMRFAFHIVGDLLPIVAPALTAPHTQWDAEYASKLEWAWNYGASLRFDITRIGMNKPDTRWRAQFPVWEIPNIMMRYNASVVTPHQLYNLAELAGFANGLGEWRPQKDGPYGRFRVKRS